MASTRRSKRLASAPKVGDQAKAGDKEGVVKFVGETQVSWQACAAMQSYQVNLGAVLHRYLGWAGVEHGGRKE